jgi:hypothetical protein
VALPPPLGGIDGNGLLAKLSLQRFENWPADWREAKGWVPTTHQAAVALSA